MGEETIVPDSTTEVYGSTGPKFVMFRAIAKHHAFGVWRLQCHDHSLTW